MALRTRKPTGLAPWPLLVIEGQEKSGKSFSTALLTGDQRIGTTYWFDIGEGAADQYGVLPGARYEVVEHDGSYRQLKAAVDELVKTVPGTGEDGRPNLVVLDSATALWALLKDEAQAAARASAAARRALERDPNAEVPITMDKWNRAANRWRGIIDPLIQWPGLVVVTARGKEVAALDDAGRPIPNAKTYTIEAHKTLVFDADVIVRAVRPGVVRLTGARSAHDLREHLDRDANWSLAALLFDVLRLGGRMGTRDLKVAQVETAETERVELVTALLAQVEASTEEAALRALWKTAAEQLGDGELFEQVKAAILARREVIKAPAAKATVAQKARKAAAGETDPDPLANYQPDQPAAA
jgi:hypothetical protein